MSTRDVHLGNEHLSGRSIWDANLDVWDFSAFQMDSQVGHGRPPRASHMPQQNYFFVGDVFWMQVPTNSRTRPRDPTGR